MTTAIDADSKRATTVRYRVLLLAMLVAVLLYLDRICMSTAAEAVSKDLKISKLELDVLLGAFFWTYALGQLPAGWLGDRFGARWMLGSYIVLWSLSTGLMGFAGSTTAILALRLSCGLFEAGAYPVAASIVRRWMPIDQRGIASSIVAVGGRLGGAVAPILTIQLMLWWTFSEGYWNLQEGAEPSPTSWRPVMMLYGVVGIAIAAVFVFLFRDWPNEHPKVNAAENELIRKGDPIAQGRDEPHTPFPWRSLLTSYAMWMCCFVQFVANFGWVFLVTKMPEYLKQVHQADAQTQGFLQSLPLVAGVLGLLLGGWFTDRLTRSFGPRWGRALAMVTSRSIVCLAFLGCLFVGTSTEATICLALVGLATDLGTPACWAFGQDVGGRHVGSAVGWSNMWGNFGAALSPVVLGTIVRSFDAPSVGWQMAFLLCAVLNLTSIFAAVGINASRKL